MKNILLNLSCLFCLTANAQVLNLNITPMPAEIIQRPGNFSISKSSIIVLTKDGLQNSAKFLNDYLERNYGFQLKIKSLTEKQKSKNTGNSITLGIAKTGYNIPGAYTMNISSKEIKIQGDNPEGVFYGIATLLQLLPVDNVGKGKETNKNDKQFKELRVPQLAIKDRPRFAYRGMHLDVSRHFFSADYVKRYIDYLALHKMNNFHWHLSDDQGWRLEIKRYPNLITVGSCRDQTLVGRFGSDIYDGKKYCGYYTQEEVKEVVAYAATRYINIIPEIDVPGHTSAALASYPFLGCTKGPYKVLDTWGVVPDVLCVGNDSTYTFLEGVLDEVIALFPSQFIHIGGDECSKERWKQCPVCQERKRTEKLDNDTALQSYFVIRLEKFINSKGRKLIGWDEILEGGIAPNAAIMSWRGERGGIAAAKLKHEVVMCPESHCYFDHSQSRGEDSVTFGRFTPVEKVYEYDPIPAGLSREESKYILGGQGNLWSEYLNNTSKLEYMAFPRLTALSEVLWSPVEKRNWKSFEKRLPGLFDRYRLWNTNFSTAYYDLQPSVIPSAGNKIAWKLESRDSNARIIYVKGRERSASFDYTGPLVITGSGEFGAATTGKDHVIKSSWTWQQFHLNKATGRKIKLTTEPNKSYSGSGGFTLVDGVQNTLGMSKSFQFLGFLGKDLEAVIDLDSVQHINEIILHAFQQNQSWIYKPSSVSFYASTDGTNFNLLESIEGGGNKNLLYSVKNKMQVRYIKIIAKNYGIIPTGNPGSGTAAWLFVDEIEVK